MTEKAGRAQRENGGSRVCLKAYGRSIEKESRESNEQNYFCHFQRGQNERGQRDLKGLKAEVLSMKEAGVSVDIVEDGDTFEANAKIKRERFGKRPAGSCWRMIPAWRWII